jgi:hypothetical protein
MTDKTFVKIRDAGSFGKSTFFSGSRQNTAIDKGRRLNLYLCYTEITARRVWSFKGLEAAVKAYCILWGE